jgi:hypothetical protein
VAVSGWNIETVDLGGSSRPVANKSRRDTIAAAIFFVRVLRSFSWDFGFLHYNYGFSSGRGFGFFRDLDLGVFVVLDFGFSEDVGRLDS